MSIVSYIQLSWILVLTIRLFLPISILSNPIGDVVLPVGCILWSILLSIQNRNRIVGRYALLLFLLALLSSFVISLNKEVAVLSISPLLIGVSIFFLVIHTPWLSLRPHRLGGIIVLLGTAVTYLSPPVIAWKQMRFRFLEVPIYDYFQSIQLGIEDTIHANVIAGALVLVFPVILSILLYGRQLFSKYNRPTVAAILIALAILTISMLGLLVLTQSRGAYLGALVAAVVSGLLRWRRVRYVLPVLLCTVTIFIYVTGPQVVFELLGADNTFGGTADFRVVMWQSAIKAVSDFSLTGIGFGSFSGLMPLLYPTEYINSTSATHAHNLFLQIGLDLGVAGAIFYLLFFVSIVIMAIRILAMQTSNNESRLQQNFDTQSLLEPERLSGKRKRRRRTSASTISRSPMTTSVQLLWSRTITIGALAAMSGMLMHGLLDAVTWGTKFSFIVWILYAAISVIYINLSGLQAD